MPPASSRSPASWSPDGRQFVYVDPVKQLTIVNADGSHPRRLLAKGTAETAAWAPRGDRIAFARLDNGLWTVRANSNVVEHHAGSVMTAGLPDPLGWSPDGTSLAFTAANSDGALAVVNLGHTGQRQLARPQGKGFALAPHWSPDGTRIAFYSITLGTGPALGRVSKSAEATVHIAAINEWLRPL